MAGRRKSRASRRSGARPGARPQPPGAPPAAPAPAQRPAWLPYALLGAGLAIVLGIVVVLNLTPPRLPPQPPPPSSSPGGALPEEPVAVETGVHISPPAKGRWKSDPPTSGQHYSVAAAWGYTEQRLPPETWVHNLEHGGVAVLYSCTTACAADQAQIHDFIQTAPRDPEFGEVKVVDAPYPLGGHRFALVAWGWRMFMDGWDGPAALSFYQRHVDRGPELLP